jgi:Uma2 family endonuclease
MPQPAPKLLTVEEFERLPEPRTAEDGARRREVIVMSPVGRTHGKIAMRLGTALTEFAEPNALGEVGAEVGFRLFADRRTVRAPDVHLIAADQPEFLEDDEGFVHGAPALAIEVTSPDDRDAYLSRKVGEYLEAGSRRVWVVRPNLKAVTVHYPDGTSRLFREGDTLASDEAGFCLTGFALPLSELFR